MNAASKSFCSKQSESEATLLAPLYHIPVIRAADEDEFCCGSQHNQYPENMMRFIDLIVGTCLFLYGYLMAPILLFLAWRRWVKQHPRSWTVCATLSFAGLLIATASGIFALGMIIFALRGGFQSQPNSSTNFETLYRCLRIGSSLSLTAIAFSFGGVWKQNSVRWLALATSFGMLCFWLAVSTWP